jgi:hypothetical protein
MTETDPKEIYKDKMQVAIENLQTAEHEGAVHLAPDSYTKAKQKIYDCKKVILQNPDDMVKIEEATEDACAAAAQLLAAVRNKASKEHSQAAPSDKEAIKVLVNEGGPVV